MDDKDIRINNLRKIMDARFGGKQVALAAAVQRQPNYISRLFQGAKTLGADLARDFENLLGIPKYSLDATDDEAILAAPQAQPLPADVQAIVDLMMQTDDEGRNRIRIYAEDAFYEYQSRKRGAGAIGLLPASLISRLADIQDPAIVPALTGLIEGAFTKQEQIAKTK